MSFREKMHWASLIAIIGGFGWYFITLHTIPHTSHDYYFGLLIVIIGAIIAIMIASATIFAIQNSSDAHAKLDERDRDIHRKGTHAAYYLLVLGCWGLAVAAHMGHGIFFLLNLLLAIIVVAEVVRIGTQLWHYRKGI